MVEVKETLLGLLEAVSRKLIDAEKTLTELDSAIGDGDCGAGIKRGFQLVLDKLPSFKEETMGGILKQVGLTLSSSIGGVSGAIYGTGFIRAGTKTGDKEDLSLQNVHEVLQAFLEGIKIRGEGTKIGDKTLVDALEPAIEAFGKSATEGGEFKIALRRALEAARKGSDSTIPLVAKKGRASYLGERSAGYRDAGSMVICLMFEAACDFFDKD